MIIIICIILGISLAASLLYNHMKKREVRKLNLALLAIINEDTNSQLTMTAPYKDMGEFIITINNMLRQNRQNAINIARNEANLKRAITNISHDLRTPLTAAKGYLQMLESPELTNETGQKYLKIITERLNAQATLMDSLFEFARVIEGDASVEFEDINLCNIVSEALSASYEQITKKGLAVDVNIPNSPIIVPGNKTAVERIVQNLIKNAYTHGVKYMGITVDSKGIEVANNAENLSGIDTSQIFDRFYIADGARTSKTTGLGLAIVQELTSQMGWVAEAKVVGEMFICKVMVSDAN